MILTSEDGLEWVERQRENSLSLEAVVWTGSRFVAVGVGRDVLISPDGLSWSKQQVASDTWTMDDVAWNGSVMVAIGSTTSLGFGLSSYFTSENGETWSVENFDCEYCHP